MRLGDWLDERTGWRALWEHALSEPVPGGARFTYVLGSTLLFLLLVQAVTGVLLAAHYAPSSTDAWASVAYVQTQVTLGWLVRGLHATGASAIMVVTALHLVQVTVWGAYRKPREVTWWVGLGMMGLLFAFALTGYLLPWDQKGYWATQVATSLVGATPLVGPWMKRFVQGGAAYGNLTLTRFYALHVLVLPAAMVLLATAHVALVRRHGVTPGWRRTEAELRATATPFWPGQLVRDLVAMALALALLFALVIAGHGVSLDAPADPASGYDARPEWYFLPLYQLLKYFPGRSEIVAALGAPLAALGLLFALPLVDLGPSRAPRDRKRFLGAVLALGAAAVLLGGLAERADRQNPAYQAARAHARAEAARALALSAAGVPPEGGTAVFQNDPTTRGRALFAERCAGCHRLGGAGERRGPDLDGWSSRGWIRAFLQDPEHERFYGKTRVRGMKPVKQRGAELEALVEWVYARGGPNGDKDGLDAQLAAKGAALVESAGCTDCHETDGAPGDPGSDGAPGDPQGDGDGTPNLGGRATAGWLRAFLLDPAGARFFGRKNDMPSQRGKLSDADLDALVALLRAERSGRWSSP